MKTAGYCAGNSSFMSIKPFLFKRKIIAICGYYYSLEKHPVNLTLPKKHKKIREPEECPQFSESNILKSVSILVLMIITGIV